MKLSKIGFAVRLVMILPFGVVSAGELQSELIYLRDTHPVIKASQYAVESARLRKNAAMAGFLPKLTLSGDAGTEKINTIQEELGASDPSSTDKRSKINLSIEQNLFNGGRSLIELKVANLDQSIRELEVSASSQDVLLEAIVSYLQVLRNRLLINLAELNENTTRQQFEMEKSRVERGGGLAVDELQAATRFQIVRERKVFYEQGMRDAVTNYEQVFGRPPVNESIQDLGIDVSLIPENIDKALAHGLDINPRVKQLMLQMDRANKSIYLEGSGFLPKIDFSVSRSRDANVGGVYKKEEDTALIKFSWNLFSGGDSINRTRAAVVDLDEYGQREINVRRKTAESIRMSWNQYQKGIERLELLEDAAKTSLRVMEGRKRLRDAGRETVLAVLDSEVEYYGVLANKVNSLIDARIGFYRLMHSMGMLDFNFMHLDGDKTRLPVKPIDESIRLLVGNNLSITSRESQVSRPAKLEVSTEPVTGAASSVKMTDSEDISTPALQIEPVQAVTNLVGRWASAWSNKDFEAYADVYGEQFKTASFGTKASWLKFRKPRIVGRSAIEVSVRDIQVEFAEPGVAKVSFIQNYVSGVLKQEAFKTMNVVQEGGAWRIISEEVKPIPAKVEAVVATQAPAEDAALQEIKAAEPVTSESQGVEPVQAVTDLVERWASAWSTKDFDAYADVYGEQFKTGTFRSKASWLKFRKSRIVSPSSIAVTVRDLQVELSEPGVAKVSFIQNYVSGALKLDSFKSMTVVQEAGQWRIVSEEVKPMPVKVAAAVVMEPALAQAQAQVVDEVKAAEPTVAAPAAAEVQSVDTVQAVRYLVGQWASAWSSKDFEAYAGMYGEQFKTGTFRSKASWLKFRKPRVMSRSAIEVTVRDVQVELGEPGVAKVSFIQNYVSGSLKLETFKTMNMVQEAGEWRIVSEEVNPLSSQPTDSTEPQ